MGERNAHCLTSRSAKCRGGHWWPSPLCTAYLCSDSQCTTQCTLGCTCSLTRCMPMTCPPSLPLSLHQSAHPTNELFPAPLSLQRPGTTCKGNQKPRFSTFWHSNRKCFDNSCQSQRNIYLKGQHAITSYVETQKQTLIC